MKNIIKTLALIPAAALTAVSCGLDVTPSDRYTVDTFWQSKEGTESAMTGCYNVLTHSGMLNLDPLLEDTATPNENNYYDAGGWNQLALGTHTANSSGVIKNRWNACYEGIGRCNTHLDRLPGAVTTDERKVQMEGETRFLRALYYYMLVTYYNGVPLIMDIPQMSQGSLPRNSREEVVDAIIKDLDRAAECLDWKWASSSDAGRATKGAALALKARLLLFEASPLVNTTGDIEKWKAAADAAKEVMDNASNAGYGLFSDYRKLFLPANEHSCECIFDVEYSKTKNTPVNSYNVYSIQYRNNAPLLNLVNSYETADGKTHSKKDYASLDPRFKATIFYPGCTFLGNVNSTANQICQFTGFAFKKLTIYDNQARDSDDGNGETNYMFIRYADILLMFAEAQNEVESTPSDEIYDALNAIRKRAGIPEIAKGSLGKDEMREAIRHERRIEFAGEGLYYNDIRRWKTAEEVMNDEICSYDGTSLAIRAFDPDRDYWWPIPADQLLLNKNLKQNPNY